MTIKISDVKYSWTPELEMRMSFKTIQFRDSLMKQFKDNTLREFKYFDRHRGQIFTFKAYIEEVQLQLPLRDRSSTQVALLITGRVETTK